MGNLSMVYSDWKIIKYSGSYSQLTITPLSFEAVSLY